MHKLLRQIRTPPFIFKHAIYAALFIILLIIIGLGFLISSSGYTVEDVNSDGDIDWNEVYIKWILPTGSEWWKYLIGVMFLGWALDASHQIYKFDKKLNHNSRV